MTKAVLWVLQAVVFVFLLLFSLYNTDTASVDTVFWGSVKAPLVLILFVVFAIGVLLGAAGRTRQLWNDRREIARLKSIGSSHADNAANSSSGLQASTELGSTQSLLEKPATAAAAATAVAANQSETAPEDGNGKTGSWLPR